MQCSLYRKLFLNMVDSAELVSFGVRTLDFWPSHQLIEEELYIVKKSITASINMNRTYDNALTYSMR